MVVVVDDDAAVVETMEMEMEVVVEIMMAMETRDGWSYLSGGGGGGGGGGWWW